MTPPAQQKCVKRDCDWQTPLNCPTWDQVKHFMDLHVQAEHAQPRAAANAGNKAPKLPRPTLSEDISEGDWNYFCEQWKRYKRAINLSAEDVTDELWACLSDDLARQCFDHGANMTTTTEKDLLALLKVYSIRSQNHLVSINLTKRENENVTKFIARVRGCAKVCNFQVKCTAAGCNTQVSYSDQLSSHVIVRGLENADIQEKVLALAATEEKDLSLQKITEFVLAQETAVQSRKLLNEDPSVYKLSQYKKDQKADVRVLNESCSHCGEIGHGYSASAEVRKALCPAYGKSCSKCNYGNHYTSLCKKRFAKERSSKSSSDSENQSSGEIEMGQFGFINTITAKGRPSSPPAPSSPPLLSSAPSHSDHYDADSDCSSDGKEFGWFSMTMVNDNKSQKNKKKSNYNTEANLRGKSNKNYVKPQVTVKASAPQRVLHQPASQQGNVTPGTQWKKIDSVVGTLIKLSLQYSAYRNNFRGGGHNRM